MPQGKEKQFPFVIREMLDFGENSQFGIRATIQSSNDGSFVLSGYSKSGPFNFTSIFESAYTKTVFNYPIPELPISVTAIAPNSSQSVFPIYVILELTVNGVPIETLAAGYIDSANSIGWPSGSITGPTDARGAFLSIAGTNPAANVEISKAVPTGAVWRLISFTFQLVTDANAANRLVSLNFTDANGLFLTIPAPAVQTATQTKNYIFADGVPSFNDTTSNRMYSPLPHDLILIAGTTIATTTTNRQVGDDFGAPTSYQEEFMQIL